MHKLGPPPQKKKLVTSCRILNNEIYDKVKIGKYLCSELKVSKSLLQRDSFAVSETAIKIS